MSLRTGDETLHLMFDILRLESDGEQVKEKSPGKANSRKTLLAESSTVSDPSDAESGIGGIATFYTQTPEQV